MIQVFRSNTMELFVGPVIHSSKTGELIVLDYAEILVNNGKIQNITTNKSKHIEPGMNVTYLEENQFLVPGFIDTHIHPVQMPNLGLGYDKGLLDWLECYTFPQELKYSDKSYAEKVMDAVVRRTLSMGTTTACYFASLYVEASMILAKAVTRLGQRALIGKVQMNCCRSDNYFESTEDSISNTIKFIQDISNLKNPLVKPIITPRFALSCDMELMKHLGKIAKEANLHIQTHISENVDEIKAVRNAYNTFPSYAAIYDGAGLLTDKTILAHAVHLTDDELQLIKERQTAIAHCPSSNTLLKSGLCDIQRFRSMGIKVGLGTDVSGGSVPSIIDSMRNALQVSIHISFQKPNYTSLTYQDVFYHATLGGAASLSMDKEIGNFELGKQFDALIIDVSNAAGPLDHLKDYSLQEQLQRFIYSGDDRNIIQVFVAGRRVKNIK